MKGVVNSVLEIRSSRVNSVLEIHSSRVERKVLPLEKANNHNHNITQTSPQNF